MDDKLLSVWRAYCDHCQHVRSCSPTKASTFSVILETLREHKVHTYSRCGFSPDMFERLDLLLTTIEQNYIWSVVLEYEKFRLRLKSPTVELQKLNLNACQDSLKLATKSCLALQHQSGRTSKPAAKPVLQCVNGELGRGKRKKFLKVKSDFVCLTKNAFSRDVKDKQKPSESCSLETDDQTMDTASYSGRGDHVSKSVITSPNMPHGRGTFVDNSFTELTQPAWKDTDERIESGFETCETESHHISNGDMDGEAVDAITDLITNVIREKLNPKIECVDYVSAEFESSGGGPVINVLQDRQTNAEIQIKYPKQTNGSLGTEQDKSIKEEVNAQGKDKLEQKVFRPLASDCNINIIETEKKDAQLSEQQAEVSTPQKGSEVCQPGERYTFDCDKLAPITCSLCKLSCSSSANLTAHRKEKHKKEDCSNPCRIYMCPSCGKTFATLSRFKLHYRIHSGARPHRCPECGNAFRTYKGLYDHISIHRPEKAFSCSICKKMFGSNMLLRRHMGRHNKTVRRIHVCDLCRKAFESKPAMRNHLSIHTGEKPHQCSICCVAFSQKSSLNTHMRLHNGDKRFICEICGARFNANMALMSHMRRHTGERPYKCTECDYRAASSSCLKDHITTHRSEKPFSCQVANCMRRFKRRAHLISHHKTHIGAEPYVCYRCGVSFSLTSALQYHLRTNACAQGKLGAES
ncbi:Zinc finger protein 28 [Plakobranchus ocellatus]|uniref:Zinc finger protein 28 n=1 Tax=Plakobranchus ocellatus TaxID=259542 RepID=A0AAV4BCQ0_9GAST|nr:Zinc finger protein 28 [Plakobranchus ocellatus]